MKRAGTGEGGGGVSRRPEVLATPVGDARAEEVQMAKLCELAQVLCTLVAHPSSVQVQSGELAESGELPQASIRHPCAKRAVKNSFEYFLRGGGCRAWNC